MGAADIYSDSDLVTLSDIEDAILLTNFISSRGHFQAASAYCAHPRGRSYSNHPDRARTQALLEFIDLYEDLDAFAHFLQTEGPSALREIQKPGPPDSSPASGPIPF